MLICCYFFLGSVSSPSKKRVLKVPLTTKSRWRSGNVSFYALLFMWWFLTQGIKLLHDLENNGLLMIEVSVIPKPHVHDMSYSHKIRLDGRWMNYETTIATKTSKKTHPIRGDIYTSLYPQPFFRTIQPVCFSRQKNPTCSPFEPKIHRKTGGCSFPIFFEPKILSFGTQGAIADVKWSWHFVGARVGWLVHFHWKED